MLKESIIFVASTRLLIYFIAPSDKAPEAEPVPAEVQKPAKTVVETPDNGWGAEEEVDDYADDESFVFGEPMTVLDDENKEKSSDEEERSNRPEQADNSGSRNPTAVRAAARPSPNSPRSGELGSLENPIVFKTNNPVDPVDD